MKPCLFVSLIFLFMLILVPQPSTARLIAGLDKVKGSATELDLQAGSSLSISWEIKDPGKASLVIVDLEGKRIRTLLAEEEVSPGTFTATWDGKDENGTSCANGVYVPVLKLISARKGSFVYNPSTLPWGEAVHPADLEYSPESQLIFFTVEQNTYGRLRVGLKDGGPVYKTLRPWSFFSPGTYTIPWDGKDKEGMRTVHDQANLAFSFDGFTLAENMLVVSGAKPQDHWALPAGSPLTIFPPASGKNSYFAMAKGSHRPEPVLQVEWQDSKEKKKPHLRGKATCTVTAQAPSDREFELGGTELLLYVDDTFVVEVPVEQLPATIAFDTKAFANGSHLVTLNLLTVDDRAGIFLQEVIINNHQRKKQD